MRKGKVLLCAISVMCFLAACGSRQDGQAADFAVKSSTTEYTAQPESEMDRAPSHVEWEEEGKVQPDYETETGTPPDQKEEETEIMINIQAGEHLLTATLVQNSSAKELLEMLGEGPVTIDMRDYGNMEKVGSLPKSLSRNDEPITTTAGDLILYQGNAFVIYYATNSWDFTRLGRIDNITGEELKDILGEGDITVVLSLPSR